MLAIVSIINWYVEHVYDWDRNPATERALSFLLAGRLLVLGIQAAWTSCLRPKHGVQRQKIVPFRAEAKTGVATILKICDTMSS